MGPFEIILIIAVVALAVLVVFFILKNKKDNASKPLPPPAEMQKDKIDILVKYVENQQKETEQKQILKNIKKADQKEKLETYKRTKEQLKDQLKNQFDAKQWQPLKNILSKVDKGSIGIYVLYNETKDKYYVGQAKAVFSRIKQHFEVEPIALDYINGDIIKVKILNANEFNAEYRIDHIEKTGIEIFDANKGGYNKTGGNL